MRRAVLEILRATHLIGLADRAIALRAALQANGENRAYRAAHVRRAFPDPLLVFEVAGHAKLSQFDRSGAAHARVIADLLREAELPDAPRILEWGCGPARILAHLPEALNIEGALYSGCDPDVRAITFAKTAYSRIEFTQSPPLPPTPFAPGAFDAIYGVSIFTHLPAAAAKAWAAELARMCAPGGCVVVSTHGARAAARLEGRDRAAFEAGRYVTLGGAKAGSRTYVSYFNENAGHALFDPWFEHVWCKADEDGGFGQDLWVLRHPRQPERA